MVSRIMGYTMFKNYLKIAIRSFLKYKGHSIINIIGLSIGIASCLLLLLWIQDELSYDRYHKKAERIYRVAFQSEYQGKIKRSASSPKPLGPALIREFPWIEKAVRFSVVKALACVGKKRFDESIFLTDPEVFEVFDFPLVKGNPETALKEPNSILISEDMRKKYFGCEDPVGEIISFDEWRDFKITGVFKNIPRNSHFRFHFLASLINYRPDHNEKWGISNYKTYILVRKDAPIDTFDERIQQFVEKYQGKKMWSIFRYKYFLQPLTQIHLYSNLRNEIEPNKDIKTVYIFSALAFFVLFIACLNYINLATAKFVNRTREVGLRKVLGASSSQLIKQFLGESILFAIITLPVALLLAKSFLPLFNHLSGKTLAINLFNNISLSAGLLSIALIVGVVAGMLPALFLSAFKPVSALKGVLNLGSFISILKRSLVVFQFSISIMLIIITMIVHDQMSHMRTKDLGLNQENVVNVHINRNQEALKKYKTIKSEFSKYHNVISVCASDFFPGYPNWNMNYWHEGVRPNEYLPIHCIPVDYDFFETLQIKFVEGRSFSRRFSTDKDAFILNEATVKDFGWESAVGKDFRLANLKTGKIIGVVKNYNFDSLHTQVKPLALWFAPQYYGYFSVRITPVNIPLTLNFLKKKWEELVPGQPFKYSFLDEDFNNLYRQEKKMADIFLIVVIIAILIACLGMWGLAVYAVEKRTKEIGIRKVLGGSVWDIALLLSKDFTRWVLAANVIAWPTAWYAMNNWLQNFAYPVVILPTTFILAGLLALITALLTISYKVVRFARVNPVESLKYE
jgi:putative ABC transport system permease protein